MMPNNEPVEIDGPIDIPVNSGPFSRRLGQVHLDLGEEIASRLTVEAAKRQMPKRVFAVALITAALNNLKPVERG